MKTSDLQMLELRMSEPDAYRVVERGGRLARLHIGDASVELPTTDAHGIVALRRHFRPAVDVLTASDLLRSAHRIWMTAGNRCDALTARARTEYLRAALFHCLEKVEAL